MICFPGVGIAFSSGAKFMIFSIEIHLQNGAWFSIEFIPSRPGAARVSAPCMSPPRRKTPRPCSAAWSALGTSSPDAAPSVWPLQKSSFSTWNSSFPTEESSFSVERIVIFYWKDHHFDLKMSFSVEIIVISDLKLTCKLDPGDVGANHLAVLFITERSVIQARINRKSAFFE